MALGTSLLCRSGPVGCHLMWIYSRQGPDTSRDKSSAAAASLMSTNFSFLSFFSPRMCGNENKVVHPQAEEHQHFKNTRLTPQQDVSKQ